MLRYTSIAAVLTVLCFATPVAAQGATGNSTRADTVQVTAPATQVELSAPASPAAAAVAPVLSLAPTRENAIVGLRLRTDSSAPMPVPDPGKNSGNTALMIVGGVALIAGAVIGGDAGTIIMVGGAGVGLYGLWQYLR